MKKYYILFLLSLFMIGNGFSDTSFRFGISTGLAEDINNNPFNSGDATVFTFLDFDLTAAPSYQPHSTLAGAFQVDISDLIPSIDDQDIVASSGLFWGVSSNINQVGNSRVNSVARAIVADGGGLTSISVGDFIGQSSNSGVVADQGTPAGATQIFDGGSVITNVEVVPEPSTLFLIGIAGLGLYVTRRFARK
jgi:hypothetical protein